MRDLLRGEPLGVDVDLVVEGDAVELARRTRPSGRVKVHERFGTATLESPNGLRIDLASARRERYARPGALPDVERASLDDDLARRDFTVNAIAWDPAARRLLDPFGGAADLAKRRLRVLHPRSFEDDPTRILRAVRYANRLGFTLERGTRRLAVRALESRAFATVSGDRLRRELVKVFSEPGWRGAIRRAEALGVLRALQPSWRPSARVTAALARAESLSGKAARARAEESRHRPWLAALLVATSDLRGRPRRELAETLALAGDELRTFDEWEPACPSEGRRRTFSREEAIARAALAPAGPKRRDLERRLLSPARLTVGGTDLIEAGIAPGPAMGRALDETRRALEDGRIEPGEQLAFAISTAREGPRRGGGSR